MSTLSQKKCVPCEGGASPFTEEEIAKYLQQVKDWDVEGGKKIRREFKFKDFKEAMEFVNKVAEIANEEDHHPDIVVHGYNKIRIELSTHAIGGLSENDFIVAAKIDGV